MKNADVHTCRTFWYFHGRHSTYQRRVQQPLACQSLETHFQLHMFVFGGDGLYCYIKQKNIVLNQYLLVNSVRPLDSRKNRSLDKKNKCTDWKNEIIYFLLSMWISIWSMEVRSGRFKVAEMVAFSQSEEIAIICCLWYFICCFRTRISDWKRKK